MSKIKKYKKKTTLGEILDTDNWELFCDEKGYDPYCIAEGGDPNFEIFLTEEEYERYFY